MSLIFYDGFETYATADIAKEWTSQVGSVAINATAGRRGGGGLLAPSASSNAAVITKTLPASVASLVVGFSFRPSLLVAVNVTILRLLDAGTLQLEIRLNADGTLSVTRSGTVLGTSSVSLSSNVHHYLELKTTIHDTLGAYELRLDGVNILSAANVDTKNTANASINQVSVGAGSVLLTIVTWTFDDLYILDTSGAANNDFLGDIRIDAIYPTADGNYKQWTPSAGVDHFALVDEATPNITDYVSDGTAGNKDSFVMSNPPALASQTIYGVKVKVAVAKDDAGARSLKIGVRSAGVDSVSAAKTLSASYIYYSNIHEVDPATGLAWSPAAVDALEALIETA